MSKSPQIGDIIAIPSRKGFFAYGEVVPEYEEDRLTGRLCIEINEYGSYLPLEDAKGPIEIIRRKITDKMSNKPKNYSILYCNFRNLLMSLFSKHNCECHWQAPYGFVPEAGCPKHD